MMNRFFTLLLAASCLTAVGQVPGYVPTDGLVAWYNLDGNGHDETTVQLHGFVQGAVPCQNRFGAASMAMEFDGFDDRVELPNNDAFNVGEVSVSLWFLAPVFEGFELDQAELISKQIGTGWGSALEVGVGFPFANLTGQVYSQHMIDGMNNRVVAFQGSGVEPGIWHHLVYTHGSSEAKFYLNGALIHSESSLGVFTSDAMPVWIGARPSGNHFFLGQIDELGLWNRVLTTEEVSNLYITNPPIEGCVEANACNYQVEAQIDDGSCHFNCEFCDVGTVWDEAVFKCVVANPADINFDGCVQLNDLLDLLTAYGNCVAEESPWQCGDLLEYQGYDYETVQIGEQCWFADNLRAQNYRNGDSIPSSVSNLVWQLTDEGIVSVFGESMDCQEWAPLIDACDPSVSFGTYGNLYNWYAVNDDRGLCASGWHVPSDAEWISLELGLGMLPEESILTDDYRGMDQGTQLKLDDGWDASETAGTNSSNFSGLPGGYRSVSGLFWDAGRNGYFWSATMQGTDQAYFRNLTFDREGVYRAATNAEYGFSVRCIKDAE